ncbi:MAG: hypothetical protein ACRDHZ_03090 [Ktedonobacteraceae bacterium]
MKSESLSDPDMQKATAALKRAAKRARQIAQQTGTAVVVIRDGQLIREIPKSTPKETRTETTE